MALSLSQEMDSGRQTGSNTFFYSIFREINGKLALVHDKIYLDVWKKHNWSSLDQWKEWSSKNAESSKVKESKDFGSFEKRYCILIKVLVSTMVLNSKASRVAVWDYFLMELTFQEGSLLNSGC